MVVRSSSDPPMRTSANTAPQWCRLLRHPILVWPHTFSVCPIVLLDWILTAWFMYHTAFSSINLTYNILRIFKLICTLIQRIIFDICYGSTWCLRLTSEPINTFQEHLSWKTPLLVTIIRSTKFAAEVSTRPYRYKTVIGRHQRIKVFLWILGV